MLVQKIKDAIRDVPNFPKEGIIFKDITPVLHQPQLCNDITDAFVKAFENTNIDAVVGIESRGFLFGFMLANKLNVPFVLIRKAGKLPYKTVACEYELEYGTAIVEIQEDEIQPDWNVLIHDDLLATGGTATAAAQLIEKQKAKVAGFSFLVELDFLEGAEGLNKYSDNQFSIVHY